MTKRPMLILNGKAKRYRRLYIELCAVGYCDEKDMSEVLIDGDNDNRLKGCRVSQSIRPSGRRIIWVHTEVRDE